MSSISISGEGAGRSPLPGLFDGVTYDTLRFAQIPSWNLTARQLSDLELLMNGGFRPLQGFMNEQDYDSVLRHNRLADGSLWPVPVVLDVTPQFAAQLSAGSQIGLRDPEGVLLATLEIEAMWQPDTAREAQLMYGTSDPAHPQVPRLCRHANVVYLGGRIQQIQTPSHHDFLALRANPDEATAVMAASGLPWAGLFLGTDMAPDVAETVLTVSAVSHAAVWVHIISAGVTVNSWDQIARMRHYRRLSKHLGGCQVRFGIVPLWARQAGERDVLLQALLNKNYGSTQLILNTLDPATGDAAAATALLEKYRNELEIDIFAAGREAVGARPDFTPDSAPALPQPIPDTGTNVAGSRRGKSGVTIFFTGLSGAGKSTIANALTAALLEDGDRPVTLLDGDLVRQHLSSELGFSREHRDLNVLRIGYVASEITRHGGIAICAPIAPYAATRAQVREMISPHGGFYEIFVSTSLEICEARDRKGLYAKARAGLIAEFTGISDPYEVPVRAEITLSEAHTPQQAVALILARLVHDGYLSFPAEMVTDAIF